MNRQRNGRTRQTTTAIVVTVALLWAAGAQAASVSKAKRAAILAEVPPETFIVYEAAEPKATVTIFTNIDCPGCRAVHEKVEELNAKGLTVRYAAIPWDSNRDEMIAVWCADDRKAAMKLAKEDKAIPMVQCDHPVDAHAALAKRIDTHFTPALVMSDGRRVHGVKRILRAMSKAPGRAEPQARRKSGERNSSSDGR